MATNKIPTRKSARKSARTPTEGSAKSVPGHGASPAEGKAAVDAFIAQGAQAHREAVQALREVILAADASVAEGIRWNAPSFRSGEWFATLHPRSKRGLGLILHRGAKVRALPEGGLAIDDPCGLLKWLAPDRATLEFGSLDELRQQATAVTALLRQWIGQL
jgi:hypothetical protein